MIPLAKESKQLIQVSEQAFWKRLDDITCGQSLNPEMSYTTAFYGNFDNVFGGRKKGNHFSVFLYRPITSGFRTEILAKGKVKALQDRQLKVDISYELPFWSFSLFCVVMLFPIMLIKVNVSSALGWGLLVLFVSLYGIVVWSNLRAVQKEMKKQLQLMETIK